MKTLDYRSRRWGIVLVVLSVLAGSILLVRWEDLPRANLLPSQLEPLSLDGIKSILILAPHCDDETLGAGGLIQAAVKAGIDTRVVIATNGDGYHFATSEEFRKVYPKSKDYIHMGEIRQQESLSALARLGISADHVYFLSYPDRGTAALLERYWSASNPYTSSYSGANKSPYPITYHPASVYAGEDYLADLLSILNDQHPDMVVFPNPEDVHPDHWGLGAFTRLALAEISHREPGYQPKQLTYLVHRTDYPVIRGLKPLAGLVPPPALASIYSNWLGWPLNVEQVNVKGQALKEYKSQISLLKGLMESFVRSNELFAPVAPAEIQPLDQGTALDPSSWRNSDGEPIDPVQLDPTGDVLSHKVAPETDLKAVYATYTSSGELWLCAELHGNASKEISYSIRLKSMSETGVHSFEAHRRPKDGQVGLTLSGNYFCAKTTLAELGNPWGIFLEATVESPDPLMPLDQTAWQIVSIQP